MMSMGFGMVRIKFLTLVNPPAHNHRRTRRTTAAMSTHLMTVRIIPALYLPCGKPLEFLLRDADIAPRNFRTVRRAYFRIYSHAGDEYRNVFAVGVSLREFECAAYCRASVQNNFRFLAHATGDVAGDFFRILIIRDVVRHYDSFAISLGEFSETVIVTND